MDMTRIPKEVQEDWESIVDHTGMTVLYLWVKGQIKKSQMELEAPHNDTYDKVCVCRGEIKALKRLSSFLQQETQRALDKHTPQKEK